MSEKLADSGEAAPVSPAGEPEAGISSTVKIGAVVVLLMGAVTAILFNTDSATNVLVYSKMVHEVMAKPGDFTGRELRVEGELKQGSIKFREQPCTWQFVLTKEGKEMPVEYAQCVVPDTFRDGMGISVTVQGKLAAGGSSFVANQVIAKCPSKYEMEERAKKGEVMPHAATAPKPQG
jgi:cytochrome c-type biogenesis protein CcmE